MLDQELGLSPMARERRKWDVSKRDGGMRPDGYEPYPRMLYRAIEVNGRIELDDQQACRLIVRSEAEERAAESRGWTHSPQEARDAAEATQEEIARLAAERHQADQRLADPARREATAYDAAQSGHTPVIPEQPVRRRRGRPRKSEQPVSGT